MIHLFALALALQAAPAAPLGVEFRAPANWVAVDAAPLSAFAPPDLRSGEALLLIVWPAERVVPPDVFAAWFERKLAGAGGTVLDQAGPERRTARGLEVLTASQRVTIPQSGQLVRVAYAIAGGDRVAFAMVTSNQDALITRYAEHARAFFESLRFPDAPPPTAVQPSAPSPLAAASGHAAIPPAGFEAEVPRGLFYRLQAGLGSTQMETRTWLFLPTGRVLRVHPLGGGESIALSRCNPDTCGAYRLEGAWLVVRWDNGDTQRLRFARSPDGLTLDGDALRPARGLAPAEAVGEWVRPGGGGNPFAGVLRLDRDGTFEWGAGSRETTLRGRWELAGLTLRLRFADGTSQSYTLFAAGRTEPLGLISFDGRVYARR